MTTAKKKPTDEDPILSLARRRWAAHRKEHPELGEATGAVIVDDDTIILTRDTSGSGSIVAVYRIEGAGKIKLLAF